MSEVTPTLQIQIRDNSQEAARGVDALSTALERLRKAVSGGLGLGGIATEIDRLTSAVRVAKNDDVAGNLNKIASALSKLSNAKNAGTAPAVKQIEQLQDRYTGLTESANQAKEAIQAPLEAQASTTENATKQITGEMEDIVRSSEKVRESVNEAKEGIGEGTVNTGSFTKGMTETMSVAELLKMRIDSIRQKMDKLSEAKQPNNDQLARMELSVRKLQAEYDKLIAKQQEAIAAQRMAAGVSAFSAMMEQKLSVLALPAPVAESISGVAEATGQITESADSATNLAGAMQSVSDASNSAESGVTGAVQVVDEVPSAAKSASFSLDDLQKKLKKLTRSSADTRRGFLGLFSSFMRIAKFRLFRTIIREISEGFATGLKNVKAYSRYVGTSYYPATVKANQALLQMKNALGAASAPFLESLVPLLQTVTNWVITASNYFNQFVALLTGKTSWTRAIVPTAESLEETERRARGASNELKELLADWDELNIIQSESGGGGYGNPNNEEEQIRSMFEQVGEFNERIQKVVNFLRENMERVKNIATDIGILIGAWMIAPALSGALGTIFAIAMLGKAIEVLFNIKAMVNGEYLSTGDDGWLLTSMLTTLVGGFVASQIIGSLIAKKYAYLGWVIMLGVSAVADITSVIGNRDVSAFDEEGLRLSVLGALEAGAAAGIVGWKVIGHNMYSLLFAGGVALATLGVTFAVEALLDVADKREVPAETYVELALGSIGLVAGVGGITYAFAHSVPTAVAAGGIALGVVGVMTGVSALLRAEKFGVDESTWITLALASIETGVAAGALIHKFGHQSISVSATAGLGVALLTIGVFGSVVALLEAGKVGVTDETWMHLAGSSVGVAIGGGLLAHSVGNMSIGYSALAGLSAGALVFGVSSGVVAVLEAQKAVSENGTAINLEVIKDMLASSIAMGLGMFGTGMAFGWGTTVAAFAGGGTAAATLSFLIGAAAVIEAKESGVTPTVVGEAIASSLLMGAAGALFMGLTGAAVATALTTGAVVALATGLVIMAAIEVATSINTKKADIEWGDIRLTEEQIQQFVSEKMFTVDVMPTLELVDVTIGNVNKTQSIIKERVAGIIPELNVLKLGLATNETSESLLDMILGPETEDKDGLKTRTGGLIGAIQESIDANKQVLKVSFALVPSIADDGTDNSGDNLKTGLGAWDSIKQQVYELGAKIGEELSKGYTEKGIANFDEEAVAAMTEKLNNVALAMTEASFTSQLLGQLGIDLSKLNRESFGGVFDVFGTYRGNLEKNYEMIKMQELANYATQIAMLKELGGEENLAEAERIQKLYDDLFEHMPEYVQAAVDKAAEPGKEMIRKSIIKMFGDGLKDADLKAAFENSGLTATSLELALANALNNPTVKNKQAVADALNNLALEMLQNALSKEDFAVVARAIEDGYVTVWDIIGKDKLSFFETAFNGYAGSQGYQELIHSILFPSDVGAGGETGASEAMKNIKDSVDEVNGVLPVAVKSATDLTSAVVTAGKSFGDLDATTKNTSDNIVRNLDNATAAAKRLNAEIYRGALLGGIEPYTRGKIPTVPVRLKADGGFVTAGDMFIAGEAGPEMIGRIGNRSAVANTDQIVSGIAGGVAAGQEEQNVLLRQQNEYLRRLLAKDNTVKVQPSAEWGKFNKRSEEMRLVNAGV